MYTFGQFLHTFQVAQPPSEMQVSSRANDEPEFRLSKPARTARDDPVLGRKNKDREDTLPRTEVVAAADRVKVHLPAQPDGLILQSANDPLEMKKTL